ncbi:helix-turn-helix domain-containing protein [Oerskovia sp. M15]
MQSQLDGIIEAGLRTDGDLSPAEFSVLGALHAEPDRALRIGELATAMGWERSRVSHLAKRMGERGSSSAASAPTTRAGPGSC